MRLTSRDLSVDNGKLVRINPDGSVPRDNPFVGGDGAGAKIGEGTAKPGMEQPVYYWDPVIAPPGMTFYTGEAFPNWQGSLLIDSLRPRLLVRLTLEGGRVAREERYLGDLGERISDVRRGPDRLLYLLTGSRDGRLLRVLPTAAR